MTLTAGHILFALLVAMASAAPAVEKTANKEEASVDTDSNNSRDKRASEEIMLSKRGRFMEGRPTKQSFGPPFLMGGAPMAPGAPMTLSDLYQPLGKNVEQIEEEVIKDKDGKVIAKEEKVILVPPKEPLAEEKGAAPVLLEEIKEEVFQPLEGGLMEEKEDIKVFKVAEDDNAPGVPIANVEQPSGPAIPDSNLSARVVPSLPETSEKADAEEVLHAKERIIEEQDDVESFLKKLDDDQDEALSNSGNGEKGSGDDKEGTGLTEAEAELQQAANQERKDISGYIQTLFTNMQGSKWASKYGQAPPEAEKFLPPYYPPYLIDRRRRRSLAHRRTFNHHQGHPARGGTARQPGLGASEKELSRAKRTKRDLFDDDMYDNAAPAAAVNSAQDLVPALYRPDPALAQAIAEQEAAEENEADMEQLIAYLVALYPALYANRPQAESLAGLSKLPGYMWYGAGYPEREPHYPAWREDGQEAEPEYVEMSPPEWNAQPVAEAPAWEPAFYPEVSEVEEQDEPSYYPATTKRQMLSFVPGQRKKRYFYPFASEPYTHWGAFVPRQEKRDYYDEAYRRLRTLAMVLADSRQQPSPYGDNNKK